MPAPLKLSKQDERAIGAAYLAGQSLRTVGQLFSISHASVLTILKRNGIPRRHNADGRKGRPWKFKTLEYREILKLRRTMSMKRIAAHIGLPYSTVRRLLMAANRHRPRQRRCVDCNKPCGRNWRCAFHQKVRHAESSAQSMALRRARLSGLRN